MFRFSADHKAFIVDNLPGRMSKDLTELFNAHFGTALKTSQMQSFISRYKLKSGVDSRFSPGSAPVNKGKPKTWVGGEATQFKKGGTPHNYAPVGSERVNTDGYAEIKVADPHKWRGKHLLVWEAHHGRAVPSGHAVIFGDRNHQNFDPDNLILVSRAQLAILNKCKLIQGNADLTRTGIILADIYQKIKERKS